MKLRKIEAAPEGICFVAVDKHDYRALLRVLKAAAKLLASTDANGVWASMIEYDTELCDLDKAVRAFEVKK